MQIERDVYMYAYVIISQVVVISKILISLCKSRVSLVVVWLSCMMLAVSLRSFPFG